MLSFFILAIFLIVVRAEQQAIDATDASKRQEALSRSLANAILAGQDWNDTQCPQTAPQYNQCRCKKGQILVGTNTTGPKTGTWSCVTVEPNCKVQCKGWSGYCGFCWSVKTESRPQCKAPEELFTAAKLEDNEFLTYDKNGWAIIEKQSPINNDCKQLCCNNSRPLCLRRKEIDPLL
jgi:hypothetical protein